MSIFYISIRREYILSCNIRNIWIISLILKLQLMSKNESGDTISISLSRDSTCRHGLHSSKKGFETFLLSPKLGKPWPSVVRKSSCIFPAWIEGEWNDVSIKGNTLTYKDRRKEHLKTYTSVCVQQSFRHKNRYLIYSRTKW